LKIDEFDNDYKKLLVCLFNFVIFLFLRMKKLMRNLFDYFLNFLLITFFIIHFFLGFYGNCCHEMDIWEANSMDTAVTAHVCNKTGQVRCNGTACGDIDNNRYVGMYYILNFGFEDLVDYFPSCFLLFRKLR
jgi:hypothetical protein